MTRLPKFTQYLKPNTQNLVLVIFCLLGLTSLVLGFKLVKPALAQVPPPTVPCGDVRSEEFHSLRPYQASPCSDAREPVALFCGNDLVLTDTITRRRSDALYCQRFSPTEEECFFRVTQNRNLAIDVSGAELPIMGRTEDDVINSQNLNETRNDAEKVNEYVSWYLNGVYPPAEYGDLDDSSEEDISKLVNFSGPIKKLLPERIKRDEIRETIEARGVSRHDQIVGCVSGGDIVDCNSGGTKIRLSDLAAHMPPVEEDPRFATYEDFLREYMEWRGYACPVIPVVNISVCIDVPWLLNYWADLYYLTPLSSTEDRYGEIQVVNPYVQPVQADVTISNVSIVTTPADLFFSHMEESQELADTLQNTFVPKGNPKSGPVSGVSPAEYCDLTEIRTNPGDDLFAGEIGVNLTYTAEFSCGFEIEEPPPPEYSFLCELRGGVCVTDDYDCDQRLGRWDCPAGYECGRGCDYDEPNPSCTRNAQVVLNTITKTPLVDDIWSRLVAGSSAVFKRIFPKVESGAPVEGILDIPAATGVTYSLNPPVPGVSLTAGNPGNRRGQAAELYFPHIGGIEQYFLQCIQTALRPQGFGEICPSGPAPSTGMCLAGGEPPDLPSASGSCNMSSGGSLNIPPALADVISSAAETIRVPPSLILGIMYGEGAFNPGRYDWTDENVRARTAEGACLPGCDPNVFPSQGIVPFSAASWENHKNAITRLYPTRIPSPCNLLDVTFALADTLRDGAYGHSAFSGLSCFGIPLNAGVYPPSSCSWSQGDVETSIKVWETGYRTASGSRCLTVQDSCLLGTGIGACSVGSGDSCETISNRYPAGNASHNACIWDVYTGY